MQKMDKTKNVFPEKGNQNTNNFTFKRNIHARTTLPLESTFLPMSPFGKHISMVTWPSEIRKTKVV